MSQLAKPLFATSLSLPAAAEAASSWPMSAGEVLVEFCRISAMTPATNGTAWEVPVRSLAGVGGGGSEGRQAVGGDELRKGAIRAGL